MLKKVIQRVKNLKKKIKKIKNISISISSNIQEKIEKILILQILNLKIDSKCIIFNFSLLKFFI